MYAALGSDLGIRFLHKGTFMIVFSGRVGSKALGEMKKGSLRTVSFEESPFRFRVYGFEGVTFIQSRARTQSARLKPQTMNPPSNLILMNRVTAQACLY